MTYRSMESVIRDIMTEKKLTPAEKKKREEVAQAIERDNPDMPMDQKMAIATATAKRVAEESELDEGKMKDIVIRQQDKKMGAKPVPAKPKSEEVEMVAEDLKSAAKELRSYADKYGGVDKDDFHKAAKHMEAGNHDAIHKHVNRLDTSPRDKVLETLHKHGNDIKRYGYTMEEVELEEAVTVNKKNYSWGKMVTVHHGNSHSYPLHPEHQEKIAKLKHDEKTSFKDETGNHVTAHRDGDTIHLSGKGTSKTTPVARSHFNEEVELDEATPTAKQVKQGIGIARDKRYAGGNMTGAVKTMDKINKGLAGHPAVKKELQKQNEAVDPADTGDAEEVSMAMNQVKQIRHYIDGIEKMVAADGDMEEWVQNKLTKATDYLKSVYGYKTGKNEQYEMDMQEAVETNELMTAMMNLVDLEEKARLGGSMKAATGIMKKQITQGGKESDMGRNESTDAYGKSVEKQADDKKKAAITDSDKQKLGALANLMAKERAKKNEEVELDELDKKTLGSYVKKATADVDDKAYTQGQHDASGVDSNYNRTLNKRRAGINKAVDKLTKEEVEMDEAVGTAAKYAGKTGFMGGKYTSSDHAITTKNFSKYRDDRAKKRDDEHKKQDPKMQKMGYAKHMVDTQKAKKKAAERGVEYKTQRSNYHNTNGITPNRKLPEEIENILNTQISESMMGHSDAEKLGASKDPNHRDAASHIDYHLRQHPQASSASGGDRDKLRHQVAKKLGYV